MEHLAYWTETGLIWGVAVAFFTFIVDTPLRQIGCRNFILTGVVTVLATAFIIECWFIESTTTTKCLIGFSVGFLADDVFTNIKVATPEFIKGVVVDIGKAIHDKIRKFLE